MCTDVKCAWDQPRLVSAPRKLDELDFRLDTSTPQQKRATMENYETGTNYPVLSDKKIQEELYELCRGTGSLISHVLEPPDGADSDMEDEPTPPTIQELAEHFSQNTDHDFINGDMFINYLHENVDSADRRNIEDLTSGQSETQDWFTHRKGRITASIASKVMHFKDNDNFDNYIVKSIMGESNNASTAAMEYGKTNEEVARQLYYHKYKTSHKRFKVSECGLIISEEYPYLGASPDGLVTCNCCHDGIIEIKCSYKFRDVSVTEACRDKTFHCYIAENGDVHLKRTSAWYEQIQMQLGVTKKQYCDFVLYTKKELFIERIHLDESFWNSLVNKCEAFYKKFVVPKLLG